MFNLYARGSTPSQISNLLRKLELTPSQISNLIARRGWATRKGEIEEVKQRSIKEALDDFKEKAGEDLGYVLNLASQSAKLDAERLKDGWGMVEGADDASSLQRAKKLHQSRVFELYGIDPINKDQGNGQQNMMAIIYGRIASDSDQRAQPVDVTALPAEAAGEPLENADDPDEDDEDEGNGEVIDLDLEGA